MYPNQNPHQFNQRPNSISQSQQINYPQLPQPYYPQLQQPFSNQPQQNPQPYQQAFSSQPRPNPQPYQQPRPNPQPYQQPPQQSQSQTHITPSLYPELPLPFPEQTNQITKPTVYYPYLAPCFAFNASSFTETNNPWSASMWLQNPNLSTITYPQLADINSFSGIESIEQFQQLRNHATVESAIGQLRELATDLSTKDPRLFLPSPTSCLICCNSYTKPNLKLGVGPINDAITTAANHKYMGYHVYFLHNPHHNDFLKFLSIFLEKVTTYLTVYYSGHGSLKKDLSGKESTGYDEIMIFDSGHIVDDELAVYLNKYSRGTAHTLLISDCCHSGTIWDIPETLSEARSFPPNIMSISGSNDNQTAKQAKIANKSQGIFTYNFFALLRSKPHLTIGEATKLLEPELKRFNQEIQYYPTRQEMLNRPVFPLMVEKQNLS